jgi:hypothetical protein
MKIYGCFLCIGKAVEPSVVLLSGQAVEFMREKMKIAETRCKDVSTQRAKVYREYFGAGVEYAIPAWSDEAMLSIVENYQEADAERTKRVRQLAACIYTGKPYSEDGDRGPQDGADGGQKAPIDPVKPKPTKPRGGARVAATVSAAA